MNASRVGLQVRLRLPLADFELELDFCSQARCLGVFGPSGCGKTSLLEAIVGWRRGARGRIALGERVWLDSAAGVDAATSRRGIGYVPQDALLFPHWTVAKNLLAGAPRAGQAELSRTLRALGLEALSERRPDTLSGGERQRVALGRALLAEPALLLLDEPLGGVDVELRRRILPWLARVRDLTSAPIVFVSHDPTEVQVLCDEVIALDQGRVRAHGDVAATLRGLLEKVAGFENVLHGAVVELRTSTAAIDVDGARFLVAREGLALGDRAAFALDSDDVLVALTPPADLSARNVLPARVVRLADDSRGVHADLALEPRGATLLRVSLSREAVEQLSIAPGLRLWAVFKSSSARLLTPRGLA